VINLCWEGIRKKSSAGARILGICPESYAPLGGTGLAARRHLEKLELEALQELLELIRFWKSEDVCY